MSPSPSPPPPMDPRRPQPPDAAPLPSLAAAVAPPRAPPPSSAFFKTRLCQKFCTTGTCHYGDSCIFAHGAEDVRRPPPPWHDASFSSASGRPPQISHTSRGRICRRFFAGEVCPYGDGCSYLHVRRDGSPPPPHGGNAAGSGRPSWTSEERGPSHQSASGWSRDSRDATTRRRDWDNAGRRSDEERFGFARELKQQPPMLSKGNKEKSGRGGTPSTHTDELFPGKTESVSSQKTPKSFSHLNGIKKLKGIYADWID